MSAPSLQNSRFVCFPVNGDQVLTSSPQRTMDKIAKHSRQPSASVGRRLNQPLRGVKAERFTGMLPSLGPENTLDFLSEPRSGTIEKAMASVLAEQFGAGPKVGAPAPQAAASPLQRARQKLGKLIPKRG